MIALCPLMDGDVPADDRAPPPVAGHTWLQETLGLRPLYNAIKEFNDSKSEDSRSRSTRVISRAFQMLDSTVLS
jgi:hypothetical protein